MKNEINTLLASDQFSDYLKGYNLLLTNVGTANLPDADLDQGILERSCAVLILEKWATHEDYMGQLMKFMENLPNYGTLVGNKEVGSDLMGLSLFINGLLSHQHELKGFKFPTQSGFMLTMLAAKKIKEYMGSATDYEAKDVAFFNDIEQWFNSIVSAQFALVTMLVKIKTWNKPMASGFYNILTNGTGINDQNRMLAGLNFALEDPIVKEHIFERYLTVLNKVKTNFTEEGKEVGDVIELIEMVEKNQNP